MMVWLRLGPVKELNLAMHPVQMCNEILLSLCVYLLFVFPFKDRVLHVTCG